MGDTPWVTPLLEATMVPPPPGATKSTPQTPGGRSWCRIRRKSEIRDGSGTSPTPRPTPFLKPLEGSPTPCQLPSELFFHPSPKFFFWISTWSHQEPPSTQKSEMAPQKSTPRPTPFLNLLEMSPTPSQLYSELFFCHNPNFFSWISAWSHQNPPNP